MGATKQLLPAANQPFFTELLRSGCQKLSENRHFNQSFVTTRAPRRFIANDLNDFAASAD